MKPWKGAMPQPAATMMIGTSVKQASKHLRNVSSSSSPHATGALATALPTWRFGKAEEGRLDEQTGLLAGLQPTDVSAAHAQVIGARLGLGLCQSHRQLHSPLFELRTNQSKTKEES
jgi:hypothetical protein